MELMTRHFLPLLLIPLLALSGCASVKNYQSTPENNIEVITKISTGPLSSTKATMFIYTITEGCKFQIEGKVKLDENKKIIGLPTDRMSYLEVVFEHSTMLQRTGSTRVESAISPKKGASYGVEVTYGKGYFDLYMTEREGKAPAKEIDKKRINAC
ncbi:MAG: hypothetical protein OEW58_09710 [Gammaproteobacteria bacterium]|nr:hypothetical protein [Gammaproteobacteria bacterium]